MIEEKRVWWGMSLLFKPKLFHGGVESRVSQSFNFASSFEGPKMPLLFGKDIYVKAHAVLLKYQ